MNFVTNGPGQYTKKIDLITPLPTTTQEYTLSISRVKAAVLYDAADNIYLSIIPAFNIDSQYSAIPVQLDNVVSVDGKKMAFYDSGALIGPHFHTRKNSDIEVSFSLVIPHIIASLLINYRQL